MEDLDVEKHSGSLFSGGNCNPGQDPFVIQETSVEIQVISILQGVERNVRRLVESYRKILHFALPGINLKIIVGFQILTSNVEICYK